MQITPVNSGANFQANHLRTAQRLASKTQRKASVDIYSISKEDAPLINNLLMKLDLGTRSDSSAIKEQGDVNSTIRRILTKALRLDKNSSDGVMIAVKNGDEFSGALDYTNGGTPLINNLVSWRGNQGNMSRANLFSEFLRKVARSNSRSNEMNQTDVVVYTNERTNAYRWLKANGFNAPKQDNSSRVRMVLNSEDILPLAQNVESLTEHLTALKINRNTPHKEVELTTLKF